jgi:hypothetical protein
LTHSQAGYRQHRQDAEEAKVFHAGLLLEMCFVLFGDCCLPIRLSDGSRRLAEQAVCRRNLALPPLNAETREQSGQKRREGQYKNFLHSIYPSERGSVLWRALGVNDGE